MATLKNAVINFSKGALIGIGAVIPGVSGGTTAMAIGAFEDILENTANFFRHTKKSVAFLFPMLFGASLGIYAVSASLEAFYDRYHLTAKLIFCCLSFISTLFFIRNNLKNEKIAKCSVFIFSGTVVSVCISALISHASLKFISQTSISLSLMGLILSIALVLPAVSFSYMLLFFGIYDLFLDAIGTFNISVLLPLGFGIILGSFVFSKLLLKLIGKHSKETYSFVLGFVLCSIIDIIIKK